MKRISGHRSHEVDRQSEENEYLVICVECGKEFSAKRYDAAFCSSTCRGREYRRRAKREETRDAAIWQVKQMLKNMPSRGDSPELAACNEIIRLISMGIHNVEVR